VEGHRPKGDGHLAGQDEEWGAHEEAGEAENEEDGGDVDADLEVVVEEISEERFAECAEDDFAIFGASAMNALGVVPEVEGGEAEEDDDDADGVEDELAGEAEDFAGVCVEEEEDH